MIILASEMPCTFQKAKSFKYLMLNDANCDEKCHDPYPTHGRIQGGVEPKGGWGEGLRGWRGGLRGTGLNLIRLSDGPWSLDFMAMELGFHGTPKLIFGELYGIEEIQDMFSGGMASNRGLLS